MDDAQLLRYSRQILLDDFGVEGQQALAEARILIVGLGGLGCGAAPVLAGAGVGHLTLADGDTVEAANLARQILYRSDDIDQPKASIATQRLRAQNPSINIKANPHHLDDATIEDLVPQFDLILDCTDNFATRYTINRRCVQAGKPLVYGAAIGWQGYQATFMGKPCLECVFPDDETSPEEDATCQGQGVVATAPLVIGTLQAVAALSLLVQPGPPADRLTVFDAKTGAFRQIAVAADPTCPVCSQLAAE